MFSSFALYFIFFKNMVIGEIKLLEKIKYKAKLENI